jgi:plastocyanin
MRNKYTRGVAVLGACVVLAGGAAACGSSSVAPTHTSGSPVASPVLSGAVLVKIHNFMFMPMNLVVKAGTKITFHNYDQTAHTATAINESFDTGAIQPGHSMTITFSKPGIYKYHCLFHAFMLGTITVQS